MRMRIVSRRMPDDKGVRTACSTTFVAMTFMFSTLLFVVPAASAVHIGTDIGCDGYYGTYVADINDLDQVVASRSLVDGGALEAVLYDHTTGDWTALPGFTPNTTWTQARAINNDGEIVGWGEWEEVWSHRGVYWPPGYDRAIVLEAFASNYNSSAAYGINDLHQAVGCDSFYALQWNLTPTGYSISPCYRGYVEGAYKTVAIDINNNHAFVGVAPVDGSHSRAFYCAGYGHPLQVLPDLSAGLNGPSSGAQSISDSGLIVGYSTDIDGVEHAVVWQPPYDSAPIDLAGAVGIPSHATGVSITNMIVGFSGGVGFAYDFISGAFEKLELPSGGYGAPSWYGINDERHICGQGYSGDEYHAFLWTPDSPPVAIITIDEYGAFGVTLNASASYDAEGEISDYSWDFGDGTFGTGIVVTHAYPMLYGGPWLVTLTVTDSIGQSDSMSFLLYGWVLENELVELVDLISLTTFEQDIKDRLTLKALKALDLIEKRENGGDAGPANILLSLNNLVSNYVLVGQIADEYEALDVIAQTNFVISLLAESSMIAGVPAYTWYHGCAPTAAGMLLGYWDANGFDGLVKGPQGNEQHQSDDVNAMIASESHIIDYVYPLDGWLEVNGEMVWVDPQPDKSELGGATDDDCIADFMHTSRSAEGLVWGQSYVDMMDDALVDYTNWASMGSYVATAVSLHVEYLTWEFLKSEVNSARPMIFVVDWNGDGWTDHVVTVLGYCEIGNARLYAFYSTWDNSIWWSLFDIVREGNFFGVSSGVAFNISLAT